MQQKINFENEDKLELRLRSFQENLFTGKPLAENRMMAISVFGKTGINPEILKYHRSVRALKKKRFLLEKLFDITMNRDGIKKKKNSWELF